MSLSLSLDIANSGLNASAQQSAVSARNIARANEAGATRKIVNLATLPGAGVRVSSIIRAPDDGLREAVLAAGSDVGAQKAISVGLATLAQTIGDPQNEQSPPALIAKLSTAIQLYASSPQNAATGQAAITAAEALAGGLNSASKIVATVRQGADNQTAAAVANLNKLLPTFKGVNDAIIQNTQLGRDTTDLEDQRDQILKNISDEIGVRTSVRANNDMVVQTDSGVILFENNARTVSFDANPNLSPGQSINPVLIDGVPVTSQTGGMPIKGGRIAGLARLANSIAPVLGKQLDEIARGLVTIFAEKDQTATPALPDIPGLFTYTGATVVPSAGSAVNGLSGKVSVSENVNAAKGGDVARLRDGGIGAPGTAAYVSNTTGASGYSDHLQSLIDKLGTAQSFDPTTGLKGVANLGDFATDSSSWVAGQHQSATSNADYKLIVLDRASTSLSNATGVNIDQEVTTMLDLERSYQASAKVLSVVNQMLDTLLGSIR